MNWGGQTSGWRWRKIQTDILEYFPEISNEDLEYVLNLVFS